MSDKDTVLFGFRAGPLLRREIRKLMQQAAFQNPGRFRWIEIKGFISSEFMVDGDRRIIALLQRLLEEVRGEEPIGTAEGKG